MSWAGTGLRRAARRTGRPHHPGPGRRAAGEARRAVRLGRAGDLPGAVTVFNQRELAAATGASRESVVRCWRAMQQEGPVATRRGRTVVLDLAGLRRWAARGPGPLAPRGQRSCTANASERNSPRRTRHLTLYDAHEGASIVPWRPDR
ncbi:helix-turn-helix domain-containing protein [Streptomyces sp. NPDC096040]|uniref:helix-turn-helix domain-containing protein n=1 Tax=Streptomyces sp. NPDC096040 TaxID=3155541 RepID=UPI003326377A